MKEYIIENLEEILIKGGFPKQTEIFEKDIPITFNILKGFVNITPTQSLDFVKSITKNKPKNHYEVLQKIQKMLHTNYKKIGLKQMIVNFVKNKDDYSFINIELVL